MNWLHRFHDGHFGVLRNTSLSRMEPWLVADEPAPRSMAQGHDVSKWMPYVRPMDDQRRSGMCEAFASEQGRGILLRAKLDPMLFTNEVLRADDDLTLDPRIAHELGWTMVQPGKPYSHNNGLPCGASITAMNAAMLASPGTHSMAIEWEEEQFVEALGRGVIELPLGIHDGWDPGRMHPKTHEIPFPIDPLATPGGHAVLCFGCYWVGPTLMLQLANSWDPAGWGFRGTAQLKFKNARWAAVDRARVITMDDPEWYGDTSDWRRVLIGRDKLAEELARL